MTNMSAYMFNDFDSRFRSLETTVKEIRATQEEIRRDELNRSYCRHYAFIGFLWGVAALAVVDLIAVIVLQLRPGL